MYFTKKEKLIILIVIVLIALISFYKILNPNPDVDIIEEEKIEETKEKIEETKDIDEDIKVNEEIVEKIMIHISGAVENPGVYELKYGSRVIDLVELSGGLNDNASLDSVNLARKLEDEEKIYIPIIGEEIEELVESSGNKSDNKININNCTKEELITLPGIGEKTAEKILNYREENKFEKIEDIMEVPGIGEKKYDDIKDMITIK